MKPEITLIEEKSPTISVVVIGRNTANLLRQVYDENYLAILQEESDELIYVDSASTDGSVEWMEACGFDTVTLSPDGLLTAAAGRNIGTQKASSQYVLYLDSDMKLDDGASFFKRVRKVLNNGRNQVGLVGNVVDHYPDGTKRTRLRKPYKDGSARTFGGFVVLSRKEVIAAGNWNSSLPGLEEQELYSRLLAQKKTVRFFPEVSVQHMTAVPNPLAELISVYLPTRKKRYGSLGKAIRNGFWRRRTIHLLLMNREIFLFAMLLVTVLIGNAFWIIGFFSIYQIDLLARKSWKYNFVVPGLFVSTIFGYIAPKEKAKPHVSK